MSKYLSSRSFCILSGSSAVAGVILLATSFMINPGPPPGATISQLVEFGRQNFKTILWGGWLQAIAPVFIVLFAFAIVHLSNGAQKLVGWMTFFGACILMTVSLIEITFYISALFNDPAVVGPVALDLIYSVQHLYFIVAAPAFFIPLGFTIISSSILPRILGVFAIALGLGFAIVGASTLYVLILPMWITALGGIQAIWWLSASIVLISRAGKISYPTLITES